MAVLNLNVGQGLRLLYRGKVIRVYGIVFSSLNDTVDSESDGF